MTPKTARATKAFLEYARAYQGLYMNAILTVIALLLVMLFVQERGAHAEITQMMGYIPTEAPCGSSGRPCQVELRNRPCGGQGDPCYTRPWEGGVGAPRR
ncbi:hypothetical protein MKK55_18100 [Methylobacterium sp. J-059]|jgi:hypothetical protein|uniref:hypothetical protein n=1 Tax=Methylobacterium sp. J-059 TaxID=2836643 RepID=UPI001FB949F3|nr:hypothetical protein [Methylobacterium sp. J-059]MCJ2040845.1 hypothetical protein [Methylobacterium sp. J-059]